MEFFVPDPQGGKLDAKSAEDIWQAARKGAEMDIGRDALSRRVFRLDYVHDGNEISAEVGAIDFYEKDLIMAIIAFPGLYSIRCRIRGVVKIGEPIIVGLHDVRHVEDFD